MSRDGGEGAAPAQRRRLLLWGMSGSGKSSVAPLLAAHTGARQLDVDARIEADAGERITHIFATRGEPAFRALERAALLPLVSQPLLSPGEAQPPPSEVVALGGGALVDGELRALALRTCFVVVLHAPAEVLAQRLAEATDRPLLSAAGRTGQLQALMERRAEAYAQGHLHIDTSGQSAAEVAAVIAARWHPVRS